MKPCNAICLVVIILASFGARVSRADELPYAEQGDRLFRLDGGGIPIPWPKFMPMDEVRLRPVKPMTLEDAKQFVEVEDYRLELENRRSIADSGRKRFVFWLPVFLIAAVGTFILKAYDLQAVGVAVGTVAGGYVVAGIIQIRMAEEWAISTGAVCALGVGLLIAFVGAVILFKDKGIGPQVASASIWSKIKALRKG